MNVLQPEVLEYLFKAASNPALGNAFGLFRGVCVYNADPLKIGRIKVHIPSLHGENPPGSDGLRWACPCVPFGGSSQAGAAMIPDVGDSVWVAFENGDPQYPVWLGSWWGRPGDVSEVPEEVYQALDTGSDTAGPQTKVLFQKGDVYVRADPTSDIVEFGAGALQVKADKNAKILYLKASESVSIEIDANTGIITLNCVLLRVNSP